MRRAISCPSCGGQHELTNPGITALNCEYCHTLVYWDEQAIHDAGVKAILDPPSSALRVGLIATLRGHDMRILGRVRYSYGSGLWDEWFLEGPGGRIVWLTEDQKELTYEQPLAPSEPIPAFESLELGHAISVNDQTLRVEELGRATCVGVEGQVPFVVIPNEVYPFVDLASADGNAAFGIEYDEEGAPTLFQGHFMGRGEVSVAGGAPFPEVVTGGAAIKCTSCGGNLGTDHPPDTVVKVCVYCGAGLELSGTAARVLFQNPDAPVFSLEIGDQGNFDGLTYEVVGRLQYRETDAWNDTYDSNEYLLWNETQGYLWIEESDGGHWSRTEPSHRQPAENPFNLVTPGRPLSVGDQTFNLVESGLEALTYVDGALPWLARVGEEFRYVTTAAPPLFFEAELSTTGESSELEYFEGRYLPLAEVAVAFERDFAPPTGVAPAQPFIRTGPMWLLMIAGALLAAVNLVAAAYAAVSEPRELLRVNLRPEQYRKEFLSAPFDVTGKPAIVRIEGIAPLRNAWVALDLGLVNAQEEVCLETDAGMSYYSGVEGGESWSEGSNHFSTDVRVDTPGKYRLLVFGSAGSGETAAAAGGSPVTLVVRDGVFRPHFFVVVFLLALVFPVIEILRHRRFEKARYGLDDDDDDD